MRNSESPFITRDGRVAQLGEPLGNLDPGISESPGFLVHSTSSKKLSNFSKEINRETEGLIEINTSGEGQKKGFLPTQLGDIQSCLNLPNLKVVGLMTIGPNTRNIKRVRDAFKDLRELKDLINSKNRSKSLSELSMGMSGDYEVAIEEGSTMIRLGTVLFGVRGSL